jgi:4-hydroxybenzoate polyprenyltransferase/phosphoserine phosphatase
MADLHIPLVVDLDGTLIYGDMLHETCISSVRAKPLTLAFIPIWLSKGKAYLKGRLAQLGDFDPANLPYNPNVLEFIRTQKIAGRKVLLCTASNQEIAQKIASYLGVFDGVMASDSINLSGKNKASALLTAYGEGGFDYIGNSHADITVWERARLVYVANASAVVIKAVTRNLQVHYTFEGVSPVLKDYLRAIRVHQWLKNLLIFIPMLAAHQLESISSWAHASLGFFAFSLCASAVYLVNDISDIEGDRQHPRKRMRPFAAGLIGIDKGLVLALLLLIGGLVLGYFVNHSFLVCLLVYLALTTAYTFSLKRLALLDCIILAGLYTLRVIAGGIAVNVPVSFWLLAFSVFIFLSLAFVKRYAELESQNQRGLLTVKGRGYQVQDMALIESLGIVSGYMAVLVLALYLNGETVVALYHAPQLIWCAVPIMLLWISYIWLKTHRGEMHDDPIIFAIEDRVSLIIVFSIFLSFILAKFL